MTGAPVPRAVDLEHVAFAYRRGGFGLEIPTFRLERGECVAVVGPSGSGKTTLLGLIAGLLRPSAGLVRVSGTPVSALSEAERRAFRISRIGFVFQDFELIGYLSARDNILYPYLIAPRLGLDAGVRARAERLAEAAGIAPALGRRPRALSQGEQQRVGVCRALVTGPDLVLADEPTGNLDPETKLRVLDLLLRETRAAGASLLAVTHDHALLPRFDRVVDFAAFRKAAA
ncbi:MAG: ABC transporter ATP-binding protein [Paracoccaceae bacterium]